MIEWGITCLSHDASLAVFDGTEIVFASHAERYSRIKNDKFLSKNIINEALAWGSPSEIHFYEKPILKKTRQIYAGQFHKLFDISVKTHLADLGVKSPIHYHSHHASHAAAGFWTSSFNQAAILCLDSIGEWETLTIWEGSKTLKKLHAQYYPHSLGLWYSSMTQRIGLKPQEHEYILMGMAALGNPDRFYQKIKTDFFVVLPTATDPTIRFRHNLHKGCLWWFPELVETDFYDIAAAVQRIFEEIVLNLFKYTKYISGQSHLVLMGGSALNCVANTLALDIFDDVWIMPNPGDAGSAIGAVLDSLSTHISWPGPFLGHLIKGEYPIEQALRVLQKNRVTGIASGRAEFGPRALGNRSLLADPRGSDIKGLINQYKQREPFRPFAPAILSEHVSEYFDVPDRFESPYMQYAVKCKRPDLFPAIVHYDNTSRVQTVNKNDNPGFRKLLEEWYSQSGCPMLLNTSLNIKGEPLLNSLNDVKRWEQAYGIPISTPIN